MDEKISTGTDSSGRKNGFYKKISTIEVDLDKHYTTNLNYNPNSFKQDLPSSQNHSYEVFHLSNDQTIQQKSGNSSPVHFDIFDELRDLKQLLLKLQKKMSKTESDSELKSEKIKRLEKISEKNLKKIRKIEGTLGAHQEKIIKFEGIFKEIEYKQLSEIKEQELLRPCLTERKIIARHTYKDYKVSSVVSSPRVKNRDTLKKLKTLVRK